MTQFPETPPLPVAGLRKHSGSWKGPEASLLEKYAGLFVTRGPARFFSELQGEALAAFLVERFRFLRRRSAGNYVLRVGPCSLPLPDGEENFTLVELLIEDRPFLTESVQFLLNARRIPLRILCHPVLRATRDPAGRLTDIGPGRGSSGNEVQIVVLAGELPARARRELLAALRETLWEIIHSVDDFSAMQKKVGALQRGLVRVPGLRRYAPLVSWLEAGNFIFLGFLPFSRRGGNKGRAAAFEPRLKEGLGHFSPDSGAPPQRAALVKQVVRLLEENGGGGDFFRVDETDVLARVHRPSPITALLFSFKSPGGRDQAIAVTGLFSDRSLRGDALEMPVVGDKIREAIGGFGLVPRSHNHKVVLDYLNGLPKIELFCLSIEGLRENVRFLLNVMDQPAIRVGYFSDQAPEAFRIVISAPGVAFPRGKLSRIRERLEAMLGSPARKVFLVQVPGFGILHLVFRLANRRGRMRWEPENLTTAILEELRERKEQLLDSWLRARGPELERRVARSLVNALPEDYQAAFSDVEALADLTQLERLTRKKQRQFALRSGPQPHGAKMVIYDVEQLSLSRIMPILSNLRLHVVEEQAYRVPLAPRPVYIHYFLLLPPEGAEIVPERDHEPLKRLVFGILDDALEDDPLNALLFACGFGWRPINLMMLLRNYLMQVGTVYTKRTINETLIRRPEVTKALFGVFQARFDPDQPPSGRAAEEAACETGLADALREIDTLTEDRIFKRLLNLIRATVRTNYFCDPEHPILAVKFDSAAIDDLPAPRPRYEIFVHGPLVEGIHLRGGMIARGGIRYSDRPDDFRTEVLGLMATQMKKNALIVPVGSKGGFVVKNLRPYGGDSRRAGDAQYANYIRALLSLTDNYVGGEVIAPERVVRYDGDDPYLVVAADKGTAHLSDTANAIAEEAGYWLGDAFASGGSNGYDHKKIAITARGAWECVKRLFWEVGVDLRRQTIRVVAIGDMAGDVFGNGMLLSRRIKLVGAFNHRHIFLDPDPNPAVSFRERERLFRRTGSAWSDYDPKAFSPGGGVFSRQAKAIPLSPQARRLLGADRPEMSGEEAIRALLKLDVELIWNGGIGTYFKAAAETHAAVGDHGNDAVRIDARECRARVIGEGGNLGLTQPARIEFDLAGGLLNTDAIDNAGGVNLSDHEVNLKILLAGRMAEGTLPSVAARN
ncbi:MAG: NAD-glutamate dehydrogenase, partial [SAR324 cluster bacterium]|nr:NAD-glutamate dehydrogenase [SAR324 cluster bacterium]